MYYTVYRHNLIILLVPVALKRLLCDFDLIREIYHCCFMCMKTQNIIHV